MLALCKKRIFCFIPVICKDCTILSREWHNHSCGLMVCFKAGDWTLCTILGYGLPERETCCVLPVNQLSHAYFLTKWKKCNIVSLFLQIHIVESTIHHSLMRTVHPFFQERSCILHFPFWRNFSILSFYKKYSASHRPEFHRNLPTADKVRDLYPFSPERKKFFILLVYATLEFLPLYTTLKTRLSIFMKSLVFF